MPVNTLNPSNLAATNARQDAKPAFGWQYVFNATNLASHAAGLGSPVLVQAYVATTLASHAAGLGTPAIAQTVHAFSAIQIASQHPSLTANSFTTFYSSTSTNYVTTSPVIDTARPGLTITGGGSGILASNLATSAAGLGQPLFNQIGTSAPANLIAGAANIGRPQFVQFQNLTAVNLATGAAGIGTPGTGTSNALLAPRASLISIDANVNQWNAAFTGVSANSTLGIIANINSLILGKYQPVSSLAVSGQIFFTGKASFSPAAALGLVNANRTMRNSAALSSSALFNASAATFIFDTAENLSAVSTFGGFLGQGKKLSMGAVAEAILTVNEVAVKAATASLAASTSLLANLVKPAANQWAGSALLAPSATLAGLLSDRAAIAASFTVATAFVSGAQQTISFVTLTPTATLRVLSVALEKVVFAGAINASLFDVTEQLLNSAKSALVPVSALAVNEAIAKTNRASLTISSSFMGLLSQPQSLTAGLSALATTFAFGNLANQFGATLAPTTSVHTTEIQKLALVSGLAPLPNFAINSQTLLLPRAAWVAQTTMATNERVLPNGTAFYFVVPNLAVSAANQLMVAKSAAVMQAQMISHEGLMLMQAPLTISSSTSFATKERFVIGPNLTLVSNIFLSAHSINLGAIGTPLVNELVFGPIQYSLNESIVAFIRNSSTINAVPSVAIAGLSSMGPACYFATEAIRMQETFEISATITAQRSRNRIVARGSLIRKFE